MAGSDDAKVGATTTEWRTESRYYRQPPGWPWLLGLALLPLLLGWIAWGAFGLGKPKVELPDIEVSVPSLTVPSVSMPSLEYSPLFISRDGTNVVLTGSLPDMSVKTSLLSALKAALPGANLVDNLGIAAGAKAPDFAGISDVFKAAVNVPDFNFVVEGAKITLTGTATSEDVKAAVEGATKAAWPNVAVVDNIQIAGVASGIGTGPAPGPTPGPSAGVGCASLQADINSALTSPINFETDGHTLTPESQQELSVVAQKLKSCPNAKVSVTGHADDTGGDAINVPLSENRAKSVGDYLASQGVPNTDITTKGVGSSQPVTGNDTEAGRAQNRRVDIMVS